MGRSGFERGRCQLGRAIGMEQNSELRILFHYYWQPLKLVVADLALLKAMVHSRENHSAFLDLNSSSERMPF